MGVTDCDSGASLAGRSPVIARRGRVLVSHSSQLPIGCGGHDLSWRGVSSDVDSGTRYGYTRTGITVLWIFDTIL